MSKKDPFTHKYSTSDYIVLPENPIWSAGFDAGLEEAAKICDAEKCSAAASVCATAIRALKTPTNAKVE